jgi:malic enzyme
MRCLRFAFYRLILISTCSQSESLALEGADLRTVIEKVQPNILLGLSGAGGVFTPAALTEMGKHSESPMYAIDTIAYSDLFHSNLCYCSIFAMSNPTRLSECTAEEVLRLHVFC